MNQRPKVLREHRVPWRVFISWNEGQSWWEVIPERFDGKDHRPPEVTIEYFQAPQGAFENG